MNNWKNEIKTNRLLIFVVFTPFILCFGIWSVIAWGIIQLILYSAELRNNQINEKRSDLDNKALCEYQKTGDFCEMYRNLKQVQVNENQFITTRISDDIVANKYKIRKEDCFVFYTSYSTEEYFGKNNLYTIEIIDCEKLGSNFKFITKIPPKIKDKKVINMDELLEDKAKQTNR